MASLKFILFLFLELFSFVLADNAANFTGWYGDQWEALEALRKRYPFAELHLSVEVEQNTLFPPTETPTIAPPENSNKTGIIKVEKSRAEIPKPPKQPPTKSPKIPSKPKKIIKKAKN
uniref:Uncharacterized protein n=1 Tax=Panagrolaimus superbus TaxID=310955 RepID=A0A914YFR8_9BILA